MRLIKRLQRSLREARVEFGPGDEIDEMGRILESAPGMAAVFACVLKDVTGNGQSRVGREGLSAERIVKLGILRKRLGLTYRGLAEATLDSLSVRRFLDLLPGEKLSRSAIHGNLKAVKDETWEKLNETLIEYAKTQGYEDGESLRGDTTTVETNIHYPTDASLLNDCVRVLSREMGRAKEIVGKNLDYVDHRRRAKTKLYRINNMHKEEKRYPQYLDLIRVTRHTVRYAQAALIVITKHNCVDMSEGLKLQGCESALKTYIPMAKKAIDQAHRRIVRKEGVPASEKIVSIFEEHTDIIVKGFRDVVFGHKISITTGASCLILKVNVLDGNPKDSTLVAQMMQDHQRAFGAPPSRAAFDGCFASFDNRDLLKNVGVKELTFSKNLSMKLETLVSSPRIHKMLLRFRAGVEGCISFLKRVFSFSRVLDRSKETFRAALQLGAAACNLTLLARYNIARSLT
jgi:IS5 family transposase